MRLVRLWLLLAAFSVGAQELPDSGLPDASVGEGGADRGSEENDPTGMACLDAKSCGGTFACVNGRCVPRPPVVVGCGAAPAGLAVLGLLAWGRRRRD